MRGSSASARVLMVEAHKGQLYLLPEHRPAKFQRIDNDGLTRRITGPTTSNDRAGHRPASRCCTSSRERTVLCHRLASLDEPASPNVRRSSSKVLRVSSRVTCGATPLHSGCNAVASRSLIRSRRTHNPPRPCRSYRCRPASNLHSTMRIADPAGPRNSVAEIARSRCPASKQQISRCGLSTPDARSPCEGVDNSVTPPRHQIKHRPPYSGELGRRSSPALLRL